MTEIMREAMREARFLSRQMATSFVSADELYNAALAAVWLASDRYDPARASVRVFVKRVLCWAMLEERRRAAPIPRKLHASLIRRDQLNDQLAMYDRENQASGVAAGEWSADVRSIDAEQATLLKCDVETLRVLVSRLRPRHRLILRWHYELGIDLKDIAIELGISKCWMSRMHAQALERLRNMLEDCPKPRALGRLRARPVRKQRVEPVSMPAVLNAECPDCGERFRTQRGMQIHWGHLHGKAA